MKKLLIIYLTIPIFCLAQQNNIEFSNMLEDADIKYSINNDIKGSIDVLTKAINLFPNHPEIFDAYLYRSDINIKRGEYNSAISDLEKLVSIDKKKNNPDIYLNLAKLYKKVGDKDAAVKSEKMMKLFEEVRNGLKK